MSHLYPLAISARAALGTPIGAALSRAEAERLAPLIDGNLPVVRLETEWLTPDAQEIETLMSEADAGPGNGFVQYYENADGAPILAVTYWKIIDPNAVEEPAPSTPTKADPEVVDAASSPPEEDHTDDLYFRSGRTKKRGSRKKIDPNQMDLFGGGKK